MIFAETYLDDECLINYAVLNLDIKNVDLNLLFSNKCYANISLTVSERGDTVLKPGNDRGLSTARKLYVVKTIIAAT